MRRRIHVSTAATQARDRAADCMRRRIFVSYEEEDTCVNCSNSSP
jgi:hypothetical protein